MAGAFSGTILLFTDANIGGTVSSKVSPAGTITITGKKPRLRSLTGIRAIAAILVFWHHGDGLYGGISSGMVGVSLFYILSGFVMAWVDREDDTASLFYRRRFARIYPAYAVAAIIAIAYAAVTIGVSWKDFFAFTLLQSWVPDETVYFAGSAVFWSLSCEAFFYVAFPFIRRVTRALTSRGLWALAGSTGLVSLSVAAVGVGFPESPQLTWAVVVFPLVRLPEFVIGVCLGSLMARGWAPRIPLAVAWVLAAAGVVAAMFAPYALSRYAVTLIPFAVLVVALASADLRGSRVFTSSKWMVRLGDWSYCFYLIHLVVIMVTISVASRVGLPIWATLAVALVGAVLAASLLHTRVEKRAEKILRP